MANKEKPTLGIGLIGSGFMGKTHVFGFATAERVFDLPYRLRFECLADQNEQMADRAASGFGFRRATGDWRTLLDDPAIDLIDITAPNAFHKEMALAAIAAGKHVYCEKPLAPRAFDAEEMALAAETANVRTQVGFNYLANPMLKLAKQMIQDGELGEITSYRGIHAEDYMAGRDSPWTWRHDPEGGGALADLGSHALATAEFLLGPISEVFGDCVTVIDERPGADGTSRSVEVDDVSRAFVRFESGATGSLEANWLATGRKMQHDFEVYGSHGALSFTQERLNELQYFDTSDRPLQQGFRVIVAGPEHDHYERFCVAPGHQLGFNDLKAIEINDYLRAVAGMIEEPFNFRQGQHIQTLVEAIQSAAKNGHWVSV